MEVKGETGTVQVSNDGVGSAGLALFNKLVRRATAAELEGLVSAYIANVMDTDGEAQEKLVEDLFVLTFQTRDVLKGKGERDLFYELIFLLFKKFPKTVMGLLRFIPEFGYWKDILRLVYYIDKRVSSNEYQLENYSELRAALLEIYANELKSAGQKKQVTLSGKWAPREGSMYNRIAGELAEKIFPEQSGTYRMRSYRKLVSGLTRVVEQKMSSKKFSEIKFEHVPSKAMDRYKKCFLKAVPEDEDRQKCAENMKEFIVQVSTGKAKIKTGTLLPHEITSQVINYSNQARYGDDNDPNKQVAQQMLEVLNLQWNGIVDKFIDDIVKECKATRENVVDLLSHSIALSDVSGSMSGIPMDVSIGMGILLAQYCKAFPNSIFTFESRPQLIQIKGETIAEKCQEVASMPWGGSTDFIAALRMMLTKAQENHISPQDFPRIMFVFSDMQFDAAVGNGYSNNVEHELRRKYSSNHAILIEDFKKAGYEVPVVIYWNLRAGTPGHETSADVEGTVMLSGYNPTLLKSVFSGEDLSKFNFQQFKKEINPLKVYENVVNSENYNRIREAVRAMKDFWSAELYE